MRRTVLLGSIVLPVTLVTAGCASQVPRADGPGGPVTPSPAVSSAPFPSESASESASGPASTPPPSSAVPSDIPSNHLPTPASTPTVLGPNGFGALKIGMTSRQATATGLIVAWKGHEQASCSLTSHLKGGTGGGLGGSEGTVLYSGDTGVEVIDAYPGVRTPEGIKLGSTSAAMLEAYPDWENVELENKHADGRGYAKVTGNSKAEWRILTKSGKVTELTLQLQNQNCYE